MSDPHHGKTPGPDQPEVLLRRYDMLTGVRALRFVTERDVYPGTEG